MFTRERVHACGGPAAWRYFQVVSDLAQPETSKAEHAHTARVHGTLSRTRCAACGRGAMFTRERVHACGGPLSFQPRSLRAANLDRSRSARQFPSRPRSSTIATQRHDRPTRDARGCCERMRFSRERRRRSADCGRILRPVARSGLRSAPLSRDR